MDVREAGQPSAVLPAYSAGVNAVAMWQDDVQRNRAGESMRERADGKVGTERDSRRRILCPCSCGTDNSVRRGIRLRSHSDNHGGSESLSTRAGGRWEMEQDGRQLSYPALVGKP